MSKSTQISSKVDAVAYVAENGYPEVGTFTEDKWLKKFYKQLPTDVIEDWVKLEGLTFKPCVENAPIHRMRACMALLYKHFPKKPTAKKPKKQSKYAKYTTEELAQKAIDMGVSVDVCDDQRIMRMRLIMLLRATGVIE